MSQDEDTSPRSPRSGKAAPSKGYWWLRWRQSCCQKRAVYVGGHAQGARDGYGKLQLRSGSVYEGQWRCGEIHGFGQWKWADGRSYKGQWERNKMHGAGKLTCPATDEQLGYEYDGQFSDGLFHDFGVLNCIDGTFYEGSWRKGREHGQGRIRLPDGKVYAGSWHRGFPHGPGELTYPGERKVYKGQFQNAKPHGHGNLCYDNGTEYVGQWQYGEPAGKGKWKEHHQGKWVFYDRLPLVASDGVTLVDVTPLSSTRGVSRTNAGLPFASESVQSDSGVSSTAGEPAELDSEVHMAITSTESAADTAEQQLKNFSGNGAGSAARHSSKEMQISRIGQVKSEDRRMRGQKDGFAKGKRHRLRDQDSSQASRDRKFDALDAELSNYSWSDACDGPGTFAPAIAPGLPQRTPQT